MRFAVRTLFVSVAVAVLAMPALAEGDPEAGKRAFAKCTACHTVEAGTHRPTGPSLAGVVGRAAGTAEGFRYSPAMQKSDVTWDDESLHSYLENPRGFIRGNRMAFPGIRNAQERADLIAYLKTLE
jgi:cytochrome c